MTLDLCKLAVEENSWDNVTRFLLIPEDMRTFEICETVINHSHTYSKRNFVQEYVPEEFQEELAEKYDIKLPEKTNERGR